MSDWVSVEDELPRDDEMVLVVTAAGNVHLWPGVVVSGQVESVLAIRESRPRARIDWAPTHWMHIPELP